MYVKRTLTDIQKKILDTLSIGASLDELAFSVYHGGDDEPSYAYDSLRVMIYRLRKMGFVISNKQDRVHSGKTGRGTPAFYKLVETPEKWR
jgi:hypothetical protein